MGQEKGARRRGARVRALKLALLSLDRYSTLPVLVEIVGMDKALEIIGTFAGTSIDFPSQASLERAVRDAAVFSTLNKSSSEGVVASLSEEFGVTRKTVSNISVQMRRLVDDMVDMGFLDGEVEEDAEE